MKSAEARDLDALALDAQPLSLGITPRFRLAGIVYLDDCQVAKPDEHLGSRFQRTLGRPPSHLWRTSIRASTHVGDMLDARVLHANALGTEPHGFENAVRDKLLDGVDAATEQRGSIQAADDERLRLARRGAAWMVWEWGVVSRQGNLRVTQEAIYYLTHVVRVPAAGHAVHSQGAWIVLFALFPLVPEVKGGSNAAPRTVSKRCWHISPSHGDDLSCDV